MDIDLTKYPPFSTVVIVRDGKRMNWNVQDYQAQPDDVIVTVLTPNERSAMVP